MHLEGARSMNFDEYLKQALSQVKICEEEVSNSQEENDLFNKIRLSLIKARITKNLTQNQLSALSGVSQSNISRIERGKFHPSLEVIKKLTDAMDLRIEISFVDNKVI